MVYFTCVNGWCRRQSISLNGLSHSVVSRCFRTQTCPLCWKTTNGAAASSARSFAPTDVNSGSQRARMKRFKKEHEELYRYLHRRPQQLHALRIKVTTSDRGERHTAGGGAERDDDDDDDAHFSDIGGSDGDDDDDVGFVDTPHAAASTTDAYADDEDVAVAMDDDDDDPVEEERAVEDDGEDPLEQPPPPQAHDADDEHDEHDDYEEDEYDAAETDGRCILCLAGGRTPLCCKCAREIRKRARQLLLFHKH